MTNTEVLDAFLEKHKITRKKGESIRLVLPWYIMDMVRNIYQNDIKGFEIKGKMQQLNQWSGRWHNNYTIFHMDFINCFDLDRQDELGDRFEEFAKYMEHNYYILYIAILDVYERMHPEQDKRCQEVASKCFLAELLCTYAEKIWRDIVTPSLENQMQFDGIKIKRYQPKISNPAVSTWIKWVAKKMSDVSFSARKFSEVFYTPKGMVSLKRLDTININGDAFYNRILLYSNEV